MITIKIEIFRIFTQKTGRINTGQEIKMNFQLTPESEVEINPDIACLRIQMNWANIDAVWVKHKRLVGWQKVDHRLLK